MHIDDRPCGACALYEFEQWGLDGVKIVGRANSFAKKQKDVKFIHKLLCYLRDSQPDKQAFRSHTQQLYTQMYESPCVIFKCYYPSVLLYNETAPAKSAPA